MARNYRGLEFYCPVLVAAFLLASLPLPSAATQPAAVAPDRLATTVSLIKDRSFSLGIDVLHADQQNRSVAGTFYPVFNGSTEPPVWTLSQWHSVHPITGAAPVKLPDGGIMYENPGKRIVFGPGARVLLGLNALDRGQHTSKHVDKLKTTLGLSQDTWTPGGTFFRLADLERLDFELAARLTDAEFLSPPRAGAAAIGFASLHIRNVDPERRELVYFVMPLYDSRERTRQPVRLVDKATGGRFPIYGTGNAALIGSQSFHDGRWITIKKDILPLVIDALQEAWAFPNFSSYSRNLADYTISQVNFRWELSAELDVEMDFRDFDLLARHKRYAPNISLAAQADRVLKGKGMIVTWTATNVVGTCFFHAGGAPLVQANRGSFSTGPLVKTESYSLVCQRKDGGTERRSISVRTTNFGCMIAASPKIVSDGRRTKLYWESANASSASIAPPAGPVAPHGSQVVFPATKTRYTMTVWNQDQKWRQCSVVVPVISPKARPLSGPAPFR